MCPVRASAVQCVSPTLFVSCTSSSGCCISEERKTDRYPEREREGAPVHLRSAALSMSEWDPTPGAGLTSMDHACCVFFLSIYYLSLVGPPSSSRRTSLTHRRTRTHAGASPDVQQGPYCRLPCPPVPYPTHCFRASLRFDFFAALFFTHPKHCHHHTHIPSSISSSSINQTITSESEKQRTTHHPAACSSLSPL